MPGWTSLMIVLCMSNAALLITVGILGEYVGRIFEESKGRPLILLPTHGTLRLALRRIPATAPSQLEQQATAPERR